MKILHTFDKGRSNSIVQLASVDNVVGVYKTNVPNVPDLVQKWDVIPFNKPLLYFHDSNSIFMEYIPGVSIKTYLEHATIKDLDRLIEFISCYIDYCYENSQGLFNYKDIIESKFETYKKYIPNGTTYNFNTMLPKSITHGDFTLDNILYYDNKFYLIDISYTVWDSIFFDINKLRQDLTGLWFVRDEDIKHNWKISCDYIYTKLNEKYTDLFNDEIYKLMLSRILPYSKIQSETEFLLKEIKRLNENNNTLRRT
jgi:hypothetical protein